MDKFEIWIIIYLVFSLIYAQSFKKANRNMKDAGALTILLELFTAFFALIFSIFFDFKFSNNLNVYITLFIVTIIYAFTDRLNVESRYGLNPSTFSMLKQLSSVFLVIFSVIFLKEKVVITKIFGALLIIGANVLLACNKGKEKLNKYFIYSFISNFLFAIAMLINVNISSHFNIGFYTFLTVFLPSLYLSIFNKMTVKKLKDEFNLYDKKRFILSSFCWCVMLISSVKAYEYGKVFVVAPLLTLSMITNSIYEFIFDKNKKDFGFKLIISIIIIIGVILIKK